MQEKMSEVERMESLLEKKLESTCFEASKEFHEGNHKYIENVYPETQLNEMDFAEQTAYDHKESKTENVLFFELSTIPKPKMNRYEFDCKEDSESFRCTGISQLEPGTKKVLYELARKGKKLNRIVIVESQDVRTKEVQGIAGDFWDDPEYMKNKCRSAVCFYKQRILDYIHRNYQKQILQNPEDLIPDSETYEMHFPEGVHYSEDELKVLFYDIPTKEISEEAPENKGVYQENSLELFMEIIHGIKGNRGKKINLYFDTQGGDRSALLQANAVVELLKDQGVEVKGRYAVPRFDHSKNRQLIKEVGGIYKTYDLVSAMTEFKLYGKGKGLKNFFKEDKDPETQEILALIDKLSKAISLCNMSAFDSALDEMKQLNEKIKYNKISVGSQLRLVLQDIMENYSELLDDDKSSPFDIVQWCINKDYYQQAITIIESKMPDMLVDCGFLHYDPEDNVTYLKNGTIPDYEDSLKLEEVLKKIYLKHGSKKSQKDKNSKQIEKERKYLKKRLFEVWTKYNRFSDKFRKIRLDGHLAANWEKKVNEFNLCKNRARVRLKKENGFYEFEYSEYDQNVRDNKTFLMFAALSYQLKQIRNKVNHAQSEYEEERVKDALKTYIKIGQELNLTEKWKENRSKNMN